MKEIIEPFLVPVVLVAAITLIAQGIFGIINTILQMRAGKASREAKQISYVVSLFQLIDGLPFRDGEKATKKSDIAVQLLPQGLPPTLRENIESLLGTPKKE